MTGQELAQMVVDSHMYYDQQFAEHVCRYCGVSQYHFNRGHSHKADCEIHEAQAIANGEVMCCKGA